MSLDEHEHGPITEYHGTIDLPKVISEGIRGGNPKTRSKHYVPEGLREEDLVSYTHPDREMALAFAQDRAKRLKLDPDKVGVVGVRGSNLPEAVEHEEPQGGIFGGTNSFVRPGGISPEYLIQASEDKMKPKKKGIVMIISVGPKMPRKPTDESTPDKEVKKAIPEEWNEQVDVNNNTSLRIIPREYLSTAAQPVSVPTARQIETNPTVRAEPGSTFRWENELQDAHIKNPDRGYKPLPGFLEQDYGGRQISGTWVAPSDLHSIMNPDYSFSRNKDSNYLLVNDTPNFYRTKDENIEGAKNVSEGFQYADEQGKAFDPEDFYSLPFPPDVSPMDIKHVAHNMAMGKTLPEHASTRLKEIEKLLERLNLPLTGGYEQWMENKRRPTNTQEAINMGIIPEDILHRKNDRIITGEPMEIAYQLLKGRKHGWRGVSSQHRNFSPITRGEEVLVKPSKRQQMLNRRTSNSIGLERTLTHAQRDEQEAMERMLNAHGNHTTIPKEELVRWGNWLPTSQTVKVKNSQNQRRYVPTKATKEGRNVRVSTGEPESRRLTRRQIDATSLPPGTSLLSALEHERFMNVLGDMANYNQAMELPEKDPEPEPVEQEPAFREKLSDAMVDASKGLFDEDGRLINTGEPMDIAFQLLKGRNLSPAARKHKLEYDTKYQSSPKRIKYRVDLNRERRRRGIYGSGNHKDVSHTQGGKLTLENEHDNRARHFKGKGTLRRVKVKK